MLHPVVEALQRAGVVQRPQPGEGPQQPPVAEGVAGQQRLHGGVPILQLLADLGPLLPEPEFL